MRVSAWEIIPLESVRRNWAYFSALASIVPTFPTLGAGYPGSAGIRASYPSVSTIPQTPRPFFRRTFPRRNQSYRRRGLR